MRKHVIYIPFVKLHGIYDRNMFFSWLDSISCIVRYETRKEELYITVSSLLISLEEYLAFEGLFKRYNIRQKYLAHLRVSEWQKALTSPSSEASYATLSCPSLSYFSPLDKDMFSRWIQRIPAIANSYVRSGTLYLKVYPSIPDAYLLELMSLCKRYHIDTKQLEHFVSKENSWWFHIIQQE